MFCFRGAKLCVVKKKRKAKEPDYLKKEHIITRKYANVRHGRDIKFQQHACNTCNIKNHN